MASLMRYLPASIFRNELRINKKLYFTKNVVKGLKNLSFVINQQQLRFNSDQTPESLKEAQEIDIEVVEKIVKQPKVYLLDVRNPKELNEEGYIPTAVNVPVDDLDDALKLNQIFFKKLFGFDKPDPKDQIIVYCRSGKRSTRAGQILLQHQYENVKNYKGSWKDWSEQHPEDVLNKN